MLGKEEIVSPSLDELKEHYHRILTLLGEDPEREGLLKTPERVAKAMLTLTKGYSMDPHEVLRSAKFKEDYNQMVIVKDIDFFLRTPHAAILWKSARGLYSQWLYYRLKQDCPRGGYFLSPPASAGTHDAADKRMYSGNTESFGRDGGGRGQTHVHANARCGKTEFNNYYVRLYGSFQSG